MANVHVVWYSYFALPNSSSTKCATSDSFFDREVTHEIILFDCNAALADIGHSQGGCLLSAMSGRSASFDQMTTQDLPLSILTSWGC